MKKAMLILGMLFFTFQVSFAQTELKKDTKQRVKKEQVIDRLDLTKDQSAKFESLQKNYAKERKNILNSDLNREAKKTRLNAIQENREKNLQAILSTEQYSKYKKMSMKRKGKRKKKSEKSISK